MSYIELFQKATFICLQVRSNCPVTSGSPSSAGSPERSLLLKSSNDKVSEHRAAGYSLNCMGRMSAFVRGVQRLLHSSCFADHTPNSLGDLYRQDLHQERRPLHPGNWHEALRTPQKTQWQLLKPAEAHLIVPHVQRAQL